MAEETISLNEASRISGVSPSTLKRWAEAKVIPVRRGRWTRPPPPRPGWSRGCASAATRSRSCGARSATAGWPSATSRTCCPATASARSPGRRRRRATGLEEELIERVMTLLGTPTALEGTLNEQDVEAIEQMAAVLGAGFPLVALLQLVRVYAQSIRKIAEAEVRLFHLYVHEPLIRQGVDALEMADEMEGLARELLPLTSPLMEYIHQRYLALLHRAGRRRPHGGRLRRRCARWGG